MLAQAQPGPTGGTVGQPLSIAQAQDVAGQFLTAQAPGLVAFHIMEFTNNFYVAAKEQATGQGAFEFLIDRYRGFVHPEPQSMMLNTKYGHMTFWGGSGSGMMGYGRMWGGAGFGSGMMGSGMMGGSWSGGSGTEQPGGTPLTLAQARAQAQRFLDARLAGTKTDEAITFPGYYTIDVERNGHPVGMLSVNAYFGQVWYHSWHATFIQEKDLD